MKRYKHLWQKMEPPVHVPEQQENSGPEQPDPTSEQSPSLLQRAAMLESWAENRSLMRASSQGSMDGVADEGNRPARTFKYGSCVKCGCARSPHVFSASSAAERRGQAFLVCNRWYKFSPEGKRLCWEMRKATSEDFKKFPKFQKQKFGDLKLSLLRNGHVDSKDS